MPEPAPATAPVESPNWDLVPIAVTCARCGQDLRGRVEPRCPACGLDFDWADACPIERLVCGHCGYHLYGLRDPRCPECGRAFTWDDALARYRRTKSDLFEYRWRDRPVRSFVKTWWRSLRPGKFWRAVDIHNPPQTRSLVAYATAMLLAIVILVVLSDAVLSAISFWNTGAVRGQGISVWTRNVLARINFLPRVPLLTAASWLLFSVLPLFVLQQSMSRFRIHQSHVVRIGCYPMPIALGLGVLCFLIAMAPCVFLHGGAWRWAWYTGAIPFGVQIGRHAHWLAVMAGSLFAARSIYCAYRYYLKMPHSAGIAIMSQVIACLAASVVYLRLTLR